MKGFNGLKVGFADSVMLSLGLLVGVHGAGMKGSWLDTDTLTLETDADWS